ncbi:hypothetical protein BCS71_25750 [Vibrio lentus]|uniref:hypothetical protein n=1 Tax=Vibrio lentus TaxID=136468 RepID=UPI000C842938|nr:hypothetical protein [Vibrio lentus]PMI58282.1 hypothetical protein BCU41_03880 [Vibrio lentus]
MAAKTAKERAKAKALAVRLAKRDFENINVINDFLGTDFGRKTSVQMRYVRRVIDSCLANERPFPNSQYMRVDGYTNAIKVHCVSVMCLDLATNTVVGFDKTAGGLVPAGNSLFVNMLNMPSRTVDEAVATLKRMGVYLSNERYKYTIDELGQKIFEGAHSIKRVCMGVFKVFDLDEALTKAVNIAKAKLKQSQESKAKTAAMTKTKTNLDGSYAAANAKISSNRSLKRAKAVQKKKLGSLHAFKPSRMTSNTQAQLDAIASGATFEEVRGQFAPQVDNCDDIPH